jgi:hypothetical protein
VLLKLLSDYLNQVEQAIVQYQNVYLERYQEEILTAFPHRKHLPNDVISCQKPKIAQVLKEAAELLK